MSQPEWFPSRPTDSKLRNEQMTFITLSTVDDLSYTPSEEQKSRDRAQIQATGRRSWKTLKGKAEAVWSPELEAVLIEGLEQYQYNDEHKPTTSKNGIRFPYRNRFISKYILEKTGKNRTHKQVGSRLQQLRDTCEDHRILSLISRGSADTDDDSSGHEQSPPLAKRQRVASLSPRRSESDLRKNILVVYTQVTISRTHPSSTVPHVELLPNDINNPVTLPLYALPQHAIPRGSSSILSMFSNAIQISSARPLRFDTMFTIYEGEEPVKQERTTLRPVPRTSTGGGHTYEWDLAGAFWKRIYETQDLSRITIQQDLMPSTASPSSLPPLRKISIIYHFEIDDRLEPSSTQGPRPLECSTPAQDLASGFASPSGSPPSYPGNASVSSSPSSWDSHGYSADATYTVSGGLHHQHSLPQSYPPMGTGSHYVLENRHGMVRSHSSSSASDYDLGHSCSYYGEPRMAQPWANNPAVGVATPLGYGPTGRRSSAFGLGYTC